MNKATRLLGVAVIACAPLGACKQESAAAPVDVRAAMQKQVNPATLTIWDVGNNAMNDDGGIDPAKLDDAAWAKLGGSAAQLAAGARALSQGTRFAASATDNAQVGEGEIAMADVQKHLDADPQGFSRMAAGLADHADKLAAAAEAKDAVAAGLLVSGLDQVCEGCHMTYWYPGQQ